MTDVNHRRKNKPPVNQRHIGYTHNGFEGNIDKTIPQENVGRTDYLNKANHGSCKKSLLADRTFSAQIPWCFSNGRKGMAKSVAGCKRFVNSRIRFHEKANTQKLDLED